MTCKELKPCPFCGNEYPEIHSSRVYGSYYVHCRQCGVETGKTELKEEAVETWNRRRTIPKLKPCYMCLNARLDDELTDKNDFSSVGVGNSAKGVRMSIDSGYGKPLRVMVTMWDKKLQVNKIIGSYYPKFCPNCGRPIIEYEEGE